MGIRAEFEGQIRCGLWAWERNSILSVLLIFPISPSSSSPSHALSPPASLQAFLLQTVDGKHQDLKYISPETVCADELFACEPLLRSGCKRWAG